MSAVSRVLSLFKKGLSLVAQNFLSLVRGRPVHLLLTGPDSVGLEHLSSLLAPLSLEKCSAVSTVHRLDSVFVTADLDDVTRSSGITSRLSRARHLVVVMATADPKVMVCRRDSRVQGLWPDGADYRLQIGDEGLKSFTEPGVLARLNGQQQWIGQTGVQVIEVSREQLVTDPSAALLQIVSALKGRNAGALSKAIQLAANRAETLEGQPDVFSDQECLKRLATQLAVYPKLAEISAELGYQPLPTDSLPSVPARRGTIVAFHTPDEVYRAEAARLRSTLEALDLEYRFFEVSPENNWVRTTLLKPSWILQAREEMSGPLLYVDVDAFVHHDPWPYLEYLEGDMGAVVYRNGQLNSATLWINDTENAREILRRWRDSADNRREADRGDLEPTGDNGDQGVLKQVVLADEASSHPRFVFHRLPVNLAYIFDRTDTYRVGPVVIEQLQVSRESLGHDKRLARRRERLLELERISSAPPAP